MAKSTRQPLWKEGWFRGTNPERYPRGGELGTDEAIDRFVGLGWFPNAPFISRDMTITVFGSCFAIAISKYLRENGYGASGRPEHTVRCSEGMVNTGVIAQQFQWAFGEKEFESPLWWEPGDTAERRAEIRRSTRALFESTKVFIVTLGLSEVWYDKLTGETFWRSVPKERHNPERHGFRITTVDENRANLETLYRLIRAHTSGTTIILTLSPIAMRATFRPVAAMTANSVSKSILRVTLDEFMRGHEGDRDLFYFPSYEIVTAYCRSDPYEDDLRHIKVETTEFIMRTFARRFLLP